MDKLETDAKSIETAAATIILINRRIRPFMMQVQVFDKNHYFKCYIYMNVFFYIYVNSVLFY